MNVGASTSTGKILVKGIHPRVTKLLRDKPIHPTVTKILRGVQPVRQIAMAKMMLSMSNYTQVFARALLLATPAHQLAKGNEEKDKMRIPAEEIARIEGELKSLERDLKQIQRDYSTHMLQLIVIQAYVQRLFQNARIAKYLRSSHPDLYLEIAAVIALPSV